MFFSCPTGYLPEGSIGRHGVILINCFSSSFASPSLTIWVNVNKSPQVRSKWKQRREPLEKRERSTLLLQIKSSHLGPLSQLLYANQSSHQRKTIRLVFRVMTHAITAKCLTPAAVLIHCSVWFGLVSCRSSVLKAVKLTETGLEIQEKEQSMAQFPACSWNMSANIAKVFYWIKEEFI